MVSMQQTSLSMTLETLLSSSKKRKYQEEEGEVDGKDQAKLLKAEPLKPSRCYDHVDLQLDTPLPLEWQRCLDIKSGQIHFYNTRTHKRTSKDPRQTHTPDPPLDLELNLTCKHPTTTNLTGRVDADGSKGDGCDGSARGAGQPSAVDGRDRQEMVAGVCMRCHMLVMMCKAAPSCPNCKFVHPPSTAAAQRSSLRLEPGSSGLFLCCKD